MTPLLEHHALTMDNIFRGAVASAAQAGSLEAARHIQGSLQQMVMLSLTITIWEMVWLLLFCGLPLRVRSP